jgi:hypothetical protein
MKLLLAAIALLMACSAATCTPSPVYPEAGAEDAGFVEDAAPIPAQDAFSDKDGPDAHGTPCGDSCANLVVLGCPEGRSECVATCNHIVITGLTPFSTSCVIGAKSADEVRKCPAIKCVK